MNGRRVDLRGAPFGLRPIECVIYQRLEVVGNDPCVVPCRLKNAPFSVSFFIIPYFQEIVKKKTCFSAQVVIK